MVEEDDKAARFQALLAERLAERQNAAKPKAEKWSVIESSLGAIYAAEDRGLSWQAISETLAKVGIHVHRETLRLYVKSIPRDFDQYPKTVLTPMKRSRLKKRAKAAQSHVAGKKGVQTTTKVSAQYKSEDADQAAGSIAGQKSSPGISAVSDPTAYLNKL